MRGHPLELSHQKTCLVFLMTSREKAEAEQRNGFFEIGVSQLLQVCLIYHEVRVMGIFGRDIFGH
jgi:hypothetical protein